MPTEDMRIPNDFDLYALGLLEGRDRASCAGRSCAARRDAGESAMLMESEPEELSVHGPWGHAQPTDVR